MKKTTALLSRMLLLLGALSLYSCQDPSRGTGIVTIDPDGGDGGDDVRIPDYPDDYSEIASWGDRGKWNLANVHDPSVAYYDGYYYMYCTDASYGNEHLKATSGVHFQGRRSKDLVNWTYVPGPMDEAPAWVAERLNAVRAGMGLDPIAEQSISYGYWAPVVRTVTVEGRTVLRMYYCIVVNNSIKTGSTAYDGSWTERAFIGLCESTDPADGVWEDKGYVICSSSDKGPDGWARRSESYWEDAYFYYNAIDPTYFVDEASGRHYLVYGSWHSGFALIELDPASGMPLVEPGDPWADSPGELSQRFGKRIATRNAASRWQGSEAPELVYKDGYYYLFMAYDALEVSYNTRVVRSEAIEGPYYDITGRDCSAGAGDCYPIVTHPYRFSEGPGWVGFSHCCIFQEEISGDWFYASQARLPVGVNGNQYSNALMMGHVRRLVWCPSSPSELDDLWPLALPERYAGLPDTKVTRDELVGVWEHIDLGYDYGVQRSSEELSLKEDGTMAGALEGNWSYDEQTGYLTLGDSIVCVEREADWEASPRRETIVYAGIGSDPRVTLWGKKVR